MDENNKKTLKHLEMILFNITMNNEHSNTSLDPSEYLNVPQCIRDVLSYQYSSILQSVFATIAQSMTKNNDAEIIDSAIQSETESHLQWFCAGIASILYFVQNNWTGPFEIFNNFNGLHQRASNVLSQYCDYNENVSYPECLYFAKIVFLNKKIRAVFSTSYWWSMRTIMLQQYISEEFSEELFSETENLIKEISNFSLLSNNALRAVFNLEVTQYYIYMRKSELSENHLKITEDILKLHLEFEGVMGKRMKHQEDKLQLFLNIKLEKEPFYTKDSINLPQVLPINDEERLEHIVFTEEKEEVKLGALEESAILTKYLHLKISHPEEDQQKEEIMYFLNTVIDSSKNWSLKMSALYQRCAAEADHIRTIERAMKQMDYLIEHMTKGAETIDNRLNLFFSSFMKPIWSFKYLLATLMFHLQMEKNALNLFLELHSWEDVIKCYSKLQLKHKAIEIIEQELAKNATVKLWCLLGDATEKVEHYETAWKLCEGKNSHVRSRVQRHWGLYYFSKKMYSESIRHLKLSLELNKLQGILWEKLGYAAIEVNDWNLAASAYRKYCDFCDQTNFEVWNNLAKAYIKNGNKERAWFCLSSAVKYNHNQWKVWDNLMMVSVDVKRFSEAIRCYQQILDFKEKHVNLQVLAVLKNAIVNNINDAFEKPSRELFAQIMALFGRLTSIVPNNPDLWYLYGCLEELRDKERAVQYINKACVKSISDPAWSQTIDGALYILEISHKLVDISLNYIQNDSIKQKNKSVLNSAKLFLQSVIAKVKQNQWNDNAEVFHKLKTLEDKLSNLGKEMQTVNSVS